MKPRPKRQRVEEPIQKAIVEFLRLVLLPGSIVHASLNEEPEQWRRIHNALMGAHAGFADLVVLTQGMTIFFEVKSKDGRQDPDQIKFERAVVAQGHRYFIVRSINDVMDALRLLEVRLRIALHVEPRKGTAWR